MKRRDIITICLLSLLFGLAWHVFSSPPPLPRKPSPADVKGATLLTLSAPAVAPTPTVKATPPLKLPTNVNPKDYVWELWKSDVPNKVGSKVKTCDGDTEYHGGTGYYYLKGMPLKQWLKGLPPL